MISESFGHPLCQFKCRIMEVHHCITDASLRVELGQKSLETRTWLSTFKLRLRVIFIFFLENGHQFFLKQDAYNCQWMKTVDCRLRQLGLITEDILLGKADVLSLVQHCLT